jgi:hypothetical protein
VWSVTFFVFFVDGPKDSYMFFSLLLVFFYLYLFIFFILLLGQNNCNISWTMLNSVSGALVEHMNIETSWNLSIQYLKVVKSYVSNINFLFWYA